MEGGRKRGKGKEEGENVGGSGRERGKGEGERVRGGGGRGGEGAELGFGAIVILASQGRRIRSALLNIFI